MVCIELWLTKFGISLFYNLVETHVSRMYKYDCQNTGIYLRELPIKISFHMHVPDAAYESRKES